MIGRRELAAALDQRTVGVEEKLRIVDRTAVTLVDADRDDHLRLLRGLADRKSLGRRYRDRLFEQALMLFTEGERRLYEGEIGVVGDDGLRELANWTPCLPSSRSFFTTFSTVPCRLYST